MARSPYLLFKRETQKKTLYYVKIWLPAEGKYTTAKSCAVLAEELGIDRGEWPPTAKAGARYIADRWLAVRGSMSRKNNPLLGEYCRDFWTWETSQYIKSKIERGQSIGRSHCNNSKYRIETYIMPRTEGVYLRSVTAQFLDNLLLQLRQELPKQSSKSINMIMSAVCSPIREAHRLGQIDKNPALNFRGLANNPRRRGILSTDEIKRLFSTPWDYEWHRLAAAVGLYCGARLGEILALTTDDLDSDFQGLPVIWIRKSWNFIEKRQKSTKTGNIRVVPVNETLRDDLFGLARSNPHDNRLVFWGAGPEAPLTERMAEHGFLLQLKKIGIGEKERKERNIVFHSLRHSFNSYLRGKVPDSVLRLATGHADPGMTENYSHLTGEKLAEIRLAVEENIIFSGTKRY